MATEVRIDKEGVPHLIDITMRFGIPNTESQLEWIENIAEIIYEGADGKMIEPKYKTKYSAQIAIKSVLANKHRIDIKIPDKIKQWVKLNSFCGKDKVGSEEYSVLPTEIGANKDDSVVIGYIVGLGYTLDECFKKITEYSEQIEGEGFEIKFDAIDEVEKEIKKMKEQGIDF